MKPDRRLVIGLVAACAVLVAHSLSLGFVSDDAFISFRYARNLLDGHGLVYNPGERVEGYTNFLWTVLLAGIEWVLPGRHLPQIGPALGLLFGCATLVAVFGFGREVSARGGAWLLVAPVLLAVDPAFAAWSGSGLEAPMFAFLVVAGAWSFVRSVQGRCRSEWAPLLFGLATLTRPDGALLFAVTAGFELMRRRTRPFSILAWAWPYFALVVPWFFLRWHYYGWPLPNTFYVKVGSPIDQWRRGKNYLFGFFGAEAWFLLPVPFALFRRRAESWVAFVAALVVAYGAFILLVGGDGLFHFRFCVHLLPLYYLLVQEGLAVLVGLAPRNLRAASAAVLLALALAFTARYSIWTLFFPERVRWSDAQAELAFPGIGSDHRYRIWESYFVDRLRAAAEWLESSAPPGARIASTPAGAIAYYSSHPVIDMLGLNDVHIAHVEIEGMGRQRAGHEKGDGAYVLSLRPEYILLDNVAVFARPLDEADVARKLVRRSEQEIWASPEFHRDYERVAVQLSDGGLFRWFTFYRRRSDAPR
jgi:arabinofuranosyltransferase